MSNNTDIFGIDEQVTQSGVLAEYKTSAEIRVRFVIENAQATNSFSIYGKIKGQTAWNSITTLTGNAITDVIIAEFDFILVVTNVYASNSNYVHFLASGIAQTSEGVSSFTAGGNDLVGMNNIEFTSTDATITITSNTNTGVIDFSVADLSAVDDLVTLSGLASGSTDLGTFSGIIIPDGSTVKSALQSLETSIVAMPSPMQYKGLWSAATNTPTLANGGGTNGYVYQVTTDGTVDFGAGNIVFNTGDKVAYNGATSVYEKWDMTDAVSSVNGYTGSVVLTKGDVGLLNVNNTSDANKPVSTAQASAIALKYDASNPSSYETTTQLNIRDTANRNRLNHTGTQSATTITGLAAVATSGLKADVGLSAVDNTSDVNKPISSATQNALNLKAPIASPALTGTPTAPTQMQGNNTIAIATTAYVDTATSAVVAPDSTTTTKGIVKLAGDLAGTAALPTVPGLATKEPNITATTSADYYRGDKTFQPATSLPTSTSTQSALDLKAPIASPTFTGTVSGVSKAMVGLANVDNTSDINKPVSSAQASAIALKIDLTQKGAALGVATLDSNSLIPITQIPPSALERLVIVTDQSARYALTTATIQNGDTVKETSTGLMYFVIDDTNLTNSAGYSTYTAGSASSVPWSGITGIPAPVTSLSGTNTGDQTAATVINTPAGNISSTTVQAALNELDSEKQATGNYIIALTGDVTATGPGSAASVVATVGTSSALNIHNAELAANAATNLNTASTIVRRDSSGNFIATTITANLTGNASGSAATFTSSLAGEVSGLQGATVVANSAVIGKVLTGYAIGANTPISSSDSILGALQKVQGQISASPAGTAGDINPTSFSAANNQVTAANVTGFAFSSIVVRSFQALVSVHLNATTELYETFSILGIQKTGTFDISIEGCGDNTGVIFSITSAGQIQYTSNNSSGFISSTVKFRAIIVGV